MTAFLLSIVFTYGYGTIYNIPTKAECDMVRTFLLEHSPHVVTAECKPQKGARQ